MSIMGCFKSKISFLKRNFINIFLVIVLIQVVLFLVWIETTQTESQALHLLVENVDPQIPAQKPSPKNDQSANLRWNDIKDKLMKNDILFHGGLHEDRFPTHGPKIKIWDEQLLRNGIIGPKLHYISSIRESHQQDLEKIVDNKIKAKTLKSEEISNFEGKAGIQNVSESHNNLDTSHNASINRVNIRHEPSANYVNVIATNVSANADSGSHDASDHVQNKAVVAMLGRDTYQKESKDRTGNTTTSDGFNLSAIQSLLSFSSNESVQSSIIETKLQHAKDLLHQWEKLYSNFTVPQDNKEYFVKIGELRCLKEGTNTSNVTEFINFCPCLKSWHGEYCSIPETVMASKYFSKFKVTLRKTPRRLVNSLPFAFEWDLLELRLYDLGDIMDAFIILDSIYTAYGDLRDLALLPRLLSGTFPEPVTRKIIPVVLDVFPETARANGWVFDGLYRDFPFFKGLPAQLKGISDDDFIIVNDADEVPHRDVLLFLKLHDNIPEPFSIRYRSTKYGFFWFDTNLFHQAGASFKMFREAFKYSGNKLRSLRNFTQQEHLLGTYRKSNRGANIMQWTIGSTKRPAGIHCTWCFKPDYIQIKLVSGINGDFPRWGDFPHKCQVPYIESLIARGMWFSETRCYHAAPRDNPKYAPKYMLQNYERYKHLLENPYPQQACIAQKTIQYTPVIKGWHRLSKTELDETLWKLQRNVTQGT